MPTTQEPTMQELIDTMPEGWTVSTLKDEQGAVREAIFKNASGQPVAYAEADATGTITASDCKF